MSDRAEYLRRIHAELQRHAREIDRLTHATADAGDDSRRRFEKRLRELRDSETEVRRRLQAAEKWRDDAEWEGLRLAVDDAMELLRRAFDALKVWDGD